MTTFSDDFNRTDSTDLGAGWVEVSGDWSIVSNQLSPGAAGGTILVRAATAMATSDNFAQVTIASTTSASQGLWCRGNSDLTSGYAWRNNGSNWSLFSVVAGAFTNIGTYSAAAVAGDVAKVQAQGSTIKGFVNGVERVSVVNTAVATGTTVGVRSDSTSGLKYDSFSAGDIASTVTGTGTATFGGLTATASGVPTVRATAAASFGSLTATAAGVPKVIASGALTAGALTGSATGLRTVISSASASFGGLLATATSPSHVTGTGSGVFGALTATASGSVPGAPEQGSWYGLLDLLREGTQQYREEQQRVPTACGDCGEPLRTAPGGVLYCPFDGSTWAAGNRRTGHVSTAGR
jgi:hypothetical protein